MSGKILSDAFSNLLTPLVKVGITLVMAPVIVSSLGNFDYGIWEMVFALVGYMGLLELGLSPAMVRYVARLNAQGDIAGQQRIFTTCLVVFAGVGLLLAGLIWGASLTDLAWLADSDGLAGERYRLFLRVVAVQVCFVFVGTVVDCFIEGLQYYALRNYLTIGFSLIVAVVTYRLLSSGGGLLTLALANACGLSLKYLLYYLLMRRAGIPGMRFALARFSPATFRELLGFGSKSIGYSASLKICTVSGALLVGAFLGPATVAFYVIPVNLMNHLRNLVWAMTRNFLPIFSARQVSATGEETRRFFCHASRLALGITLPLGVAACLLGPDFLRYWMGESYAVEGRGVLLLVAGAYLVQWLNPFASKYLTAIDRHGILAVLAGANAALHLLLGLLLVHWLGKEGVALAILLPALLLEPLLLVRTCRLLGLTVRRYLRAALVPNLVPVTLFAAAITLVRPLVGATSLGGVFASAAWAGLLYLPLFFLVTVESGDRQFLYRRLRSRRLSQAG